MALKMKLHSTLCYGAMFFAAMSIMKFSTGGSKLVENSKTELHDGDSDGHDHEREAHQRSDGDKHDRDSEGHHDDKDGHHKGDGDSGIHKECLPYLKLCKGFFSKHQLLPA